MRNKSHSDVKSHRVGRATMGTGVVTTAYRAVVAFTCIQCGQTIAPGAVFSRQPRHTPLHAPFQTSSALASDPVCVICRPLRLDTDEGL